MSKIELISEFIIYFLFVLYFWYTAKTNNMTLYWTAALLPELLRRMIYYLLGLFLVVYYILYRFPNVMATFYKL